MSFQRLSERVQGKSRPLESRWKVIPQSRTSAEKLLSPSLLCVRGTSSFRMSLELDRMKFSFEFLYSFGPAHGREIETEMILTAFNNIYITGFE